MNIYEDGRLEQKFEKLTDLMGELVLDILLDSLRKVVRENQVFQEWAEVKMPVEQKNDAI
ncbi:MAG: hypothetical protein KAT62_07205 [Desulfuromonadales bacterium]|nr:hypothetical protein [Chloroflexota bacterium]MCK4621989.1 hypothetical protein [Desulfuromonadales bacterium]